MASLTKYPNIALKLKQNSAIVLNIFNRRLLANASRILRVLYDNTQTLQSSF